MFQLFRRISGKSDILAAKMSLLVYLLGSRSLAEIDSITFAEEELLGIFWVRNCFINACGINEKSSVPQKFLIIPTREGNNHGFAGHHPA